MEAAVSGDIVVLRTSGSLTSYPEYFIGALASFTPATVDHGTHQQPGSGCGSRGAVPCGPCRSRVARRGQPVGLPGPLARRAARFPGCGGGAGRHDGRHQRGGGLPRRGCIRRPVRNGDFATTPSTDPMRREVSVSRPVFAQPELDGDPGGQPFHGPRARGPAPRLPRALCWRIAAQGPVVGIWGWTKGTALTARGGQTTRSTSRGDGGGVDVRGQPAPRCLSPGVPLTLDGIRRVRLPGWQRRTLAVSRSTRAGNVRGHARRRTAS